MPSPRSYASATAFRTAFEQRLKQSALSDRVDPNRLRRQASFDRLLVRLFRNDSAPWILKGGHALELRFTSARATVDIDLTLPQVAGASADSNQVVQEMLNQAVEIDLNDWFQFIIGPPMMDLDAAPYGGARFPVEARMDNRTFTKFHLDAGIGDVIIQPVETILCPDWLGFAGIEPSEVRMISREQQFAEKIHAYTLPRNAPNSRVKDLVDMALLIGAGGMDRERIVLALNLTFDRRKTHDLPARLEPPPPEWQTRFTNLAEECRLPTDIAVVFDGVQAFLQELFSR